MIKKHRIVALCLALLMVAGLLAACNNSASGSPSPSTEASAKPSESAVATDAATSATPTDVEESEAPIEQVTIEMMIMNPQWKMRTYGDDPGTKQMLDKTGVTLSFVIPSGDATEKANAMLAAGDYPEIMQLGRGVPHDKYVAAGAWFAYNDLWEQYPQYADMKGVYPEMAYKLNLQSDGKLYSALNWFSEDGFGNAGCDINVRSDVWTALGEPEWTNISEYVDACKELKANASDYSINDAPFSAMHMDLRGTSPQAWIMRIANAHGARMINQRYVGDDGTVQFVLRSSLYVDALKWLNMCWSEGILDPETFTFTDTTIGEARQQGRFAFDWTEFWSLRQASSALKLIDPDLTFIAIETPEFVEGVRPMLTAYESCGGPAFEITKNCKNPEAALRFAHYYLSDEGGICSFYGAEGETMYYENDDKTKPRLMPGCYEKKMEQWDEYGFETGIRKLDFMQNQKWNWERTQEPPDHMAYRNMAMAQAFDASMLNVITIDAESESGRIWSAIQPTLAAEYAALITSTPYDQVEAKAAELLKKIEEQGLATVEAEWTKIYNELNSR